ncbi:MAG: glycosyltransferase, partial [Eubacteriales bacterium]|nr:glycosyltransferase [Eubacteriales bacterium]
MSFVICDIIGVPINNINMNEAVSLVLLYMDEEKKDEAKIIFTPNPEFVMNALKDKEFMEILNNSTLNIADGIGIVIGSK